MSERPPEIREPAPTGTGATGATGTPGARLRRLLTRERTGVGVEVCAAVALETLPVMGWLIVLAADNDTPADVPLPYWWIFLVTLGAWGVGTLLRRQRLLEEGGDGAREATIIVILGWAVTSALAVLLSPCCSRR